MIRGLTAVALALNLAACLPPSPKHEWQSFHSTDAFTDESWCDVTFAGRDYAFNYSYAYNGFIYPVVRVREGTMVVAFTTASVVPGQTTIAIPVGDLQVRIDSNPAETLLASETPGEINQSYQKMFDAQAKSMNLTPEQQAAYTASTQGILKTMSPVTAVAGDRAQAIVKEMLTGKTLIYRQTTTGMNGRISEIPLEGFAQKLADCQKK
jgi:hypothetical protein